MDTYRNFINGKWIESTSAKTVDNINPSNTADVIGSNRQATRDEARAAVEAAGYTGPIEVEIFNQQIWDTPGDQVLARIRERYPDC